MTDSSYVPHVVTAADLARMKFVAVEVPTDNPAIDALCQVLARIVARVAAPAVPEPTEGLVSEGAAR